MRIFIVCGTCGEYSDRSEWLVMAYTDESKALAHVERATTRANEIYAKWNAMGFPIDYDTNEHDQNMRIIAYDCVRYYIEECELIA